MLDKRCIALLNAINNECNSSGYKIFSFEQLISFMPSRLSINADGVRESLSYLANHEFISIKYQDEGEVCLRPLVKGRVEIENKSDKERSEGNLKRKLIIFSFLGGLIGGLLSGLIIFAFKLIGGI